MRSAGLTVAEYFRDAEGQDVLLFVDNIFRFTQVPRNTLSLFLVVSRVGNYTDSYNVR